MLPVMVKSYFPPDFAAVDRNLTRFQSLSLGIRQIPDIASFPNLLHGLRMIEEYVDDHPQYHSCGRGMACDLVPAGIGRLKVYLRYWGRSFDEIWDYYTLGGRIPGLDDDRDKLREMVELAHGRDYPASKRRPEAWAERRRRHMFATKPTSLYFSLTPDNPYPVPKLYFYPAQTAPNDEAIAQGIDAWMAKYGWQDGGKTLEERVRNVLYGFTLSHLSLGLVTDALLSYSSHRRLDEKPGIFTFIGIGRKEGSTDLSVQAYVTPELYETPRY
jgi:DMATS type aromatic prenyltransferase